MKDARVASPPVVKDPDASHPIPGAWRSMLREVVHCFVEGDYRLSKGVKGVEPISTETADQVREYLEQYGARLVELPDDSWETSVAQWMGTHWDILVDLWTAEEGRSDLVLHGRVVESSTKPRLTVHMVYVP